MLAKAHYTNITADRLYKMTVVISTWGFDSLEIFRDVCSLIDEHKLFSPDLDLDCNMKEPAYPLRLDMLITEEVRVQIYADDILGWDFYEKNWPILIEVLAKYGE